MNDLIRTKLEQATGLIDAADVDVWLVFDRDTADGGDPILPLILEGGLTWQSALMMARGGRRVAVVGNYDAPILEASGHWDSVVGYVEGIREPLVAALEELIDSPDRAPRIAVDFSADDAKADGLRHGMYLRLERYLRGTRFDGCLVSAEEIVMALRSCKTAVEVGRMQSAIAATEHLFDEMIAQARVGASEREIYDFVQGRIDARGLGYGWDRAGDPMVNCGPESMVGHGGPSVDIRLQPGHILHLDLGVIVDGYSSDIQRCWYVPRPGETELPAEVGRALSAVAGAISAGAALVRPGIEGWRVDEAARRFIMDAGYPEYMHALGHQVGRMAHDGGGILGPRWERYGRTPELLLQPDQVYTLELGVTVEDHGYLGLEEMVRVTESDLDWLTTRQLRIPLLDLGS